MMKVEIPINQANRLINSGNVVMVTAQYKDKSSIITIAWHCPVSIKPSIIGVAVGKSRFSAELIERSGEFIVNVPGWELFEAMIFCGTRSGREVDKFQATGLTPLKPVKLLKPPRIKECIGAIECAVADKKEIGDHIMFFGEVAYAEAEEGFFKDGVWDTGSAELIYHLGGSYFMKSCPVEKGR